MKSLRGIGPAVVIVLASTPGLWACTAQSTVDAARHSRDSDEYRAARDVAEEFVDEEGFVRDEPTVEAGIGTLLTEAQENVGGLVSDPRAILDLESAVGHGLDGNRREITIDRFWDDGSGGNSSTCTVRDHMRLHVKQWDDALKGLDPELMNSWNGDNPVSGNLPGPPASSGPVAPPVSSPPPSVPRAPDPITAPPAATPDPVEDHAG